MGPAIERTGNALPGAVLSVGSRSTGALEFNSAGGYPSSSPNGCHGPTHITVIKMGLDNYPKAFIQHFEPLLPSDFKMPVVGGCWLRNTVPMTSSVQCCWSSSSPGFWKGQQNVSRALFDGVPWEQWASCSSHPLCLYPPLLLSPASWKWGPIPLKPVPGSPSLSFCVCCFSLIDGWLWGHKDRHEAWAGVLALRGSREFPAPMPHDKDGDVGLDLQHAAGHTDTAYCILVSIQGATYHAWYV